MINTNEIVVGLDVGTTKIAAVVGRRADNNKIEILGVGKSESTGVQRGVVSNIINTVNSIKLAVQEAEEKSGVEIKAVTVGIAGQHIRSLQHRGIRMRNSYDEEINQKDIDALVDDMYKLAMLPGEEIIHVLPQEFIVDNEQGIKHPIGMCGSRLEANFHIITGQVTAINNLMKCIDKAGLKIDGITLEPLASAEAVLTDEEKEAGVVLVDIGGGTTDIAIFQEGIIRHTAVIPFGGEVITNDIKEGCTIIKPQAELLKIKFGSAISQMNSENEIVSIPGLRGREPKEISLKNLASIIEARMEEIIEHIFFEIKNSGLEKKLIAGIVVTGGGAQLKHIAQLMQYVTGMDTRVGVPSEHLTQSNNDLSNPMYATSVGLVIKALHDVKPEFDFSDNKEDEVKKPTIAEPTKKERSNFIEKFLNRTSEFFNDKTE